MGSSRQEYWSGLPCPPPGDLPEPGIEPVSPALAGGFFTTKPCGKWFEPKSPLNSSYLSMVFPVVMYGCESWTVKKAERQRIDAFELWCWRRLESPLDCKEIQPVHSEGDQPWDFFGGNDAEAETPVLWPPHAKS